MKHQKVIKRKTETERSKIMYKYAQLKRLHHDLRLQVHMYAFMYIYPYKMPVKDHFSSTKTCVVNYKKLSTPVPATKSWLGISYIFLEDYELNQKFGDTELKNN